MTRRERYTRLIVGAAAVGAVAIPLVSWARTPLIHARMAESGGWSPDVIRAKVGQPLHLHVTSDDVVHGFAVGQVEMQSVDVLPGKVTDVSLTFDKPGTYTFYCTRWCGVNHWRMRGRIEVSGAQPDPQIVEPALYVSLGLDLDAARAAPQVPARLPVAAIVPSQFAADVAEFQSAEYYRAHSPYETWQALHKKSALAALSDQELWALTAAIWKSNTTPAALADAARPYAQNCAACHGENGAGDGVFADDLAAAGASLEAGMAGAPDMRRQRPANFADAQRMLAASPALLQGKILRGGMGTGMPNWGPIFTEQQTWDLVAYLYSFLFQYR